MTGKHFKSWSLVPMETLPRVRGGVDYGAPQSVLARFGERRLLKMRGSMYFGGVGHRAYAQAGTWLQDNAAEWQSSTTPALNIKEGRLGKQDIVEAQDRIDAFFGGNAAWLLIQHWGRLTRGPDRQTLLLK